MNLKEIGSLIITVGGWIVAAIKQVYSFIEAHKVEIEAIVLRVQKDAQDGWTETEKEQMAIDLFNQYILPKMSWWMKIVYKLVGGESFVRKTIREICNKSHLLKDNVITNKEDK